ncbi:hypothetical protein [Aureimonas sp. AU4]|uniref:hypothetical protein n=1 Tax=Aureimonas sp. AU4 TaxID=1638163 RepID=UPI000784A9F2|nr:hypothetical protein [Aureimonas sp. AU4]
MSNIKAEKAKQGRSGRNVLVILVAALALCLVVFAGLGIYGSVLPDQNIGGVQNSDVSGAPATPTSTPQTTVTPGQSNSASGSGTTAN